MFLCKCTNSGWKPANSTSRCRLNRFALHKQNRYHCFRIWLLLVQCEYIWDQAYPVTTNFLCNGVHGGMAPACTSMFVLSQGVIPSISTALTAAITSNVAMVDPMSVL